MTDAPKMNAYMVALSFEKGPLLINAVMATTEWAATAIVATAAVQQLGITENLMGCNVQQLMPEFLDIARGGGAPATVLSIVPHPQPLAGDIGAEPGSSAPPVLAPAPPGAFDPPPPTGPQERADPPLDTPLSGRLFGWGRSMPEDEPPGAA